MRKPVSGRHAVYAPHESTRSHRRHCYRWVFITSSDGSDGLHYIRFVDNSALYLASNLILRMVWTIYFPASME